jgi:uncharacterized protein
MTQPSPTPIDLAFSLCFAVVVTWYETKIYFPRFRARLASGDPDARGRAYRRTMIGQWAIAAIALVIWRWYDRPWALLGLVPSTSPRMAAIGGGAVLAIAVFAAFQIRAVLRTPPAQLASLEPKLGGVAFLLPHSPSEARWFIGLACTAGVCEELLYRGYLLWVLGAYMNLPAAVAINVLLFAAGHSYQGVTGALKAGTAGLVLALIVVGSGWVVPAMIVHAVLDIAGGVVGFAVLRASSAKLADPA